MQKYIERMKIEVKELDDRISKAEKALENPPFGSDKRGLDLLSEQVKKMKAYSVVLHQRIEYEVSK